MKTIYNAILFLGLIINVNALAQNGVKTTILEKGEKLGLRPVNQSDLNVVNFDGNNKAYYMSFDGNRCNIYVKDAGEKAYAVFGAILDEYLGLMQGESVKGKDGRLSSVNQKYFLGAPISDEFPTPQKNGRGQHFEGGSIYWSPSTGAHEVHGAIRDKWKSIGWENSFLGFPVTNEMTTPDGFGRYNFFEGGAIYFHPNLGTFAVPKMIADVWKKEGWEKGKLGYPVADEMTKNNNSVQYFEFGAVISTKASPYRAIYNSSRNIRGLYTKWRETGGIDSYLGDLVTPNRNYPKIKISQFAEFQKGFIYESYVKQSNSSYDKEDAFVILKGPIFDYYASKKWEQGYLGLPISDEFSSKKSNEDIRGQQFQGGTIYVTKSLGAFEKKN
ncbi:MAG: hypothetical protein IAE62_07810 [Flavobacteriales bacterium]|nr:hypothetical protein [Flavobacteriales bacterium]